MEKLKLIIKTKKTKQKSNNHNNKQKIDKTKKMGVVKCSRTINVSPQKLEELVEMLRARTD